MRLRRGSIGALALVLAACQVLPTDLSERVVKAGAKGATPTAAARKASPTPEPASFGKASPSAAPSAVSTAAPTPSPTLPPWGAGPMKALSGKALIDASYALKMGGTLVSNNGGTVVSNNGSGVISNNGGAVIAIGSGLLSNNGGGLLSNNGSGLLSDKGLGYRLLAEPAVAQGLLLPVKGLMVTPVSLTTSEQIGPTVLTDATGTYALQVPEAQKGNIRLVASVPGKDANDPVAKDERLQYHMIVPVAPKADETQMDEDSALMSKFLRMCFLRQLDQIFSAEDQAALDAIFMYWAMTPEMKQIVLPQISALASAARAAGYAVQPAERKAALCQFVLDVLMAHVDLQKLDLEKAATTYEEKFTGKVMPSMIAALRFVREKASGILVQNPQAFEQNEFLLESNAQRPPEKAYKILKGTDFGEYVVREFLGITEPKIVTRTSNVLGSIGARNNEKGEEIALLLNTGATSIVQEVAETLLFDKDGAKTEVVAVIKRFGEKYGPQPSPMPSAKP